MLISVKVIAKAKSNQVIQLDNHLYKVKTTAAATQNKANIAVIALLAKHFGVKKSAVELISGERYKQKRFNIEI